MNEEDLAAADSEDADDYTASTDSCSEESAGMDGQAAIFAPPTLPSLTKLLGLFIYYNFEEFLTCRLNESRLSWVDSLEQRRCSGTGSVSACYGSTF